MPMGREARQRRGRSARSSRDTWKPRVDVFGTLRFPGEGEARGRLMEYAPGQYAFFTQGAVESPLTFAVTGDFHIKGRVFTAQLDGGQELKFQKAGCGCETPHELRGPRSRLLREAGLDALVPESAGQSQEPPET